MQRDAVSSHKHQPRIRVTITKSCQTGDFTAPTAFYFNRTELRSAGNDEIDLIVTMPPVCDRIINRIKVIYKMPSHGILDQTSPPTRIGD